MLDSQAAAGGQVVAVAGFDIASIVAGVLRKGLRGCLPAVAVADQQQLAVVVVVLELQNTAAAMAILGHQQEVEAAALQVDRLVLLVVDFVDCCLVVVAYLVVPFS